MTTPPDAGIQDPAGQESCAWDLEYRLNDADEIISFGGAWHEFAAANGGAALTGSRVVGRSIWSFISGAEARSLYRHIFAGARSGRRLRFPFRCDSPTNRRLFEMEVTVDADGLLVRTRTLSDEPWSEGPATPPDAPRGDELLSVCGWCGRVHLDDGWVEVEEAARRLELLSRPSLPQLTHGICDDCRSRLRGSLA